MPGDKINIAHMMATPSFGGPDATVLSLFQKLDPARYRQYLIFLKSPSTLNHMLVEKSRDLGIETILLSTRGKVNLPSLVRALGRVEKNRIDILHSHNYKTDILTYYISRFYSSKIASTLHGWTERNRRMRLYK